MTNKTKSDYKQIILQYVHIKRLKTNKVNYMEQTIPYKNYLNNTRLFFRIFYAKYQNALK